MGFWLTVVMLCCCVCNWSAIQTTVARLPFSLPVHLPCLSIVINVAPPYCGAFFLYNKRLVFQSHHLFHVSTIDLLFVAISVFIRNHTGIVIGLGFTVGHNATSIIGVHNVIRTGTGAQGKSQHTCRDNCGSLFIFFSLKLFVLFKADSVTGLNIRLTLFSITSFT